ncbi:hypothetical protein [Halomontanus rarus]|uniref:hypothetical protein n=1 Tax=Halomontanus rarus TaxID=3034020 RepID=UPI0023E8102C|nr:hypothetical protein [Halovivax sp. TS33]
MSATTTASATDEQTYTAGIVVGTLLVILGVAAYVVTDFASVTALIPSFFGILFVVLGRLGRDAGRRSVAVYGLGLLALLGIAGSAMGISDAITLATGGDVERPGAAVSQAVMVVLSLLLLVQVGRSLAGDR